MITKKFIWLTLIGLTIGALGGWMYYYFVGCHSGTCAITSNPVNSSVYGAIMGGLLLNTFRKESKKETDSDSKEN